MPLSLPRKVMLMGTGSSVQGVLRALKAHGLEVCTYLTKESYSPATEGRVYSIKDYPNPCQLFKDQAVDFVIPMSIDWHLQPWRDQFLALNIPILSPVGEAMLLERDRDFAKNLCLKHNIKFPKSFVANNRNEAEAIIKKAPVGYVIKNPLCSPASPIHTILCETVEDTLSWLDLVDYKEGIFLQEYLGGKEAGHIAFITGGEVYSLISNQEYKYAFDGNLGIIAAAPLGGIIEKDPHDKYNLAKELLHPLLPWFKKVNFHGPVQVTAMKRDDKWYVLEYNVRIGITCGPIIMRMLKNPVKVLWDTVRNKKTDIQYNDHLNFGCSVTLAGYGYPFTQVKGPSFPVKLVEEPDCNIWWNEVKSDANGSLFTTGHRIADVVAIEATLEQALEKVYKNIRKIRCSNSYFRTDIGQSKWPPGED